MKIFLKESVTYCCIPFNKESVKKRRHISHQQLGRKQNEFHQIIVQTVMLPHVSAADGLFLCRLSQTNDVFILKDLRLLLWLQQSV